MCHPEDGTKSAPAKVNLARRGWQFGSRAKERELLFVSSLTMAWVACPPRVLHNVAWRIGWGDTVSLPPGGWLSKHVCWRFKSGEQAGEGAAWAVPKDSAWGLSWRHPKDSVGRSPTKVDLGLPWLATQFWGPKMVVLLGSALHKMTPVSWAERVSLSGFSRAAQRSAAQRTAPGGLLRRCASARNCWRFCPVGEVGGR